MARKIRIISQAHEWVRTQGLCADDGTFSSELSQGRNLYVPTLAQDDPFSGAEAVEFYAESCDENPEGTGAALGYCEGVQFPDGSAVWWTTEFWSFTDPHGVDITRSWQVNETRSQ